MRDIVVYTLLFSAMIQLLMATYAWSRISEPAAKPVILLFILSFIWVFAYALDMASSELQIKILWTKVFWTSASLGPFIFLLIVIAHLEITHLLTRWRIGLLLIPSILVSILVWSIPYHNLLLYDFSVAHIYSLYILRYKQGVLYIPIFLILQGISLITYYYLIRSLPNANPIKRRQSITILFALLVPFIVNVPTILDINPIKGFDFTPYSLLLTSGLFALAIFRYGWLDIIPLARSTLVEVIPVGVMVLDAKNRIVDINPSAQQILQVTSSIVGHEKFIASTKFIPTTLPLTDPTLSKREIKTEIQMEQDGKERYFDVHSLSLQNQRGEFNGHIIMFHDITERKQAGARLQAQLNEIASLHNQLHEQAIRDALTGLFNRGYLNDMLERETHRAQRHQHPFSVLMIEIDSFKRFNDTFGHEAGDVTLQQMAKLIQANIRTDDIACRFGGDEFTLIMPETPLESAIQCAERLRENAAILALQYNGNPLGNLTLSIGVAVFPKHGQSGAVILQAADKAMYQAKQAGKNRVTAASG